MSDEYSEFEYVEPMDIRKFCRALEEAWKIHPETQFGELLESVFNGYSLHELRPEELMEMLNDFILQNK